MNQNPIAHGHVSDAVSLWIEQTQALLGQAQTAMESLRHHEGIAPDAQTTIYQLLVLLRQHRAQAPTEERVRTWVASLSCPTHVQT